jgi:hypothetical protein
MGMTKCQICNNKFVSTEETKVSQIIGLPFICCDKCSETNAEPYWMIVNTGVAFKYKTTNDIPEFMTNIIIATLEVKGFTLEKYFEDIKQARKTIK